MLYYELEDGLYTAGPYFFAKVRADSKCFRALQKRVLWKHPAKYSLWQHIPNSLEELQRLTSNYMVHRKAGAEKQKQYVSG